MTTRHEESEDQQAVLHRIDELLQQIPGMGDLGVPMTAQVLRHAAAEARGIEVLGEAMAKLPDTISPELARSLQAEENWWRRIEAAWPSLSSTETAELLGRSSNRTYASEERKAGRMLGYKRGSSYRYPLFQFDAGRRCVLPVIGDLLAITRGSAVADDELMLWLCTPSGYFDEQDEPIHHLGDPEGLLEAARLRFEPSW